MSKEGAVRFEVDLDRGLERCEDALLRVSPSAGDEAFRGDGGWVPASLGPSMERIAVSDGTAVIRQHDPPGDVYVLEEGRLVVETVTAEGRHVRLQTLGPGAVVGEMALYTGAPRTADVVADGPCVVLRCSQEQIARLETEDRAAAAVLHRWFAETLARRLTETMHSFETLRQ